MDINNNTRGSRNKAASLHRPRQRPYTYSVVFAVRRKSLVRRRIDHKEHFAGGGAEPPTSDPPDQAPPHPPQHPQPRHRRAARARGQHGNIIRWFGKYFKLMSYWLIIRLLSGSAIIWEVSGSSDRRWLEADLLHILAWLQSLQLLQVGRTLITYYDSYLTKLNVSRHCGTATHGPTLVCIQDTDNNVFGALVSSPLVLSEHFYGTGETFLFQASPRFQVYNWSGDNPHFARYFVIGIVSV